MNPEAQQKIDEVIFETDDKINAIVNEIRIIRFSNMDDAEKQPKLDHLREEFEKVMMEEEKKVEQIMTDYSD